MKICTVEMDFSYRDLEQEEIVVEDVEGVMTRESAIKRKLLEAVHGVKTELIK